MALLSCPAPNDGPASETRFDYVRFEGNSFDPGVFQRDGSLYLGRLSDPQKETMKASGLSVRYGRETVSPVAEPIPRGKRYEARVPDTIDLADRLNLSLNALTEILDRTADCEPYSHFFCNPRGWTNASFQYNPDMERGAPVFLHDIHGYNTGIGEGCVEGIPMLRLATGSTLNMDVSQTLFDNTRRMIGEDGLPRFPLEGRPWALFTAWWVHDPLTGRSQDKDLTMTGEGSWGRYLSTLAVWYAITDSPTLKSEIETVVQAFDRLERARPDKQLGFSMDYALVQAYKFTGYEPALDLARRVIARTRRLQFNSDGTFGGHFHGTTFKVLAMAELAKVTGDEELMDFVRKSYEFARGKGWPIVGFYPEGIDQDPPIQESCSFTHLPKIAAILSQAGVGEYWDDINQLARNQMIENQLTDYEWLYDLAGQIPNPTVPAPEGYDGKRNVGRRLLGGFASYAGLNDYFTPLMHAPGPIVGCCTGNGARALYYVWYSILTRRDDGLYVNLLFNRASKWADVDSYLPYEGRVEIKMKETSPLRVRMPGWVDLARVACTVDGRSVPVQYQGHYASPEDPVAAGQTAAFRFPIEEKTVRLKIGTVDATLVIRGATVVDITPEGRYCPLYQNREKYRTGKIQWKNTTRFVPDEDIEW